MIMSFVSLKRRSTIIWRMLIVSGIDWARYGNSSMLRTMCSSRACSATTESSSSNEEKVMGERGNSTADTWRDRCSKLPVTPVR